MPAPLSSGFPGGARESVGSVWGVSPWPEKKTY